MLRSCSFVWLVCVFAAGHAGAQPPASPPAGGVQPAPLATQPAPVGQPAPQGQPEDPTVVGNMEHLGWSLSGPRARHYIFGGLAVADYTLQGRRRIVTLQEQTDFPKPDPDYLYYRELRSGHWWAFRKHPWPDRTYSVWFRNVDEPGSKWQRLQLAALTLPGERGAVSEATASHNSGTTSTRDNR